MRAWADWEKNMESEVDDSLILTIPFTANVKLRSVVLKCGPGDHTPKSMQIVRPLSFLFDLVDRLIK